MSEIRKIGPEEKTGVFGPPERLDEVSETEEEKIKRREKEYKKMKEIEEEEIRKKVEESPLDWGEEEEDESTDTESLPKILETRPFTKEELATEKISNALKAIEEKKEARKEIKKIRQSAKEEMANLLTFGQEAAERLKLKPEVQKQIFDFLKENLDNLSERFALLSYVESRPVDEVIDEFIASEAEDLKKSA